MDLRTFNERREYWRNLNREETETNVNFSQNVLTKASTTGEAIREAIKEIQQLYDVKEDAIDIDIIREGKDGFLSKRDASVKASLKKDVAIELTLAYKRSQLEKKEQEKDQLLNELYQDMLPKLETIIGFFPEILLTNFRALEFDIKNYVADRGQKADNLMCVMDDLFYAWYLVSAEDFIPNYRKCADYLLMDILVKYEGRHARNFRGDEFRSVGQYGNYTSWLAHFESEFEDHVAKKVLPMACGQINDLDEHELNLFTSSRNVGLALDGDNTYSEDNRTFILGKYFVNLCMIPVMWEDIKNAYILSQNDELISIIYNNNDGALTIGDMTSIYEIYRQYYSSITPDVMPYSDFKNAANMALLLKSNEGYSEKYKSLIDEEILDVDRLLCESMSKKRSDMSFMYFFMNDILQTGKLDYIFEKDNPDKYYNILMYCLCNKIHQYYDNPKQWASEMIQACVTFDTKETYYNKYKLLHPNQEKKDAVKEIRQKLSEVATGEDFEKVLKLIYEQMGFQVHLTKASGDQGADLVLEKNDIRTVVQAKFYSSPVGNSAVQEVVGALNYYDAQKAVVVTNSTFTNAAVSLALVNDVQLIDGDKLELLISALA